MRFIVANPLRSLGHTAASGGVSTPSIALVNNDDGTVTVTVSGSTVGSTNTIYVAEVDNQWDDPIAWVSGGTRTGNGNVTVTFDAAAMGAKFFYCLSALSSQATVSVPKYLIVSDGSPPVWDQILEAVVARIRLLTLEDVASDDVRAFTVIDESFPKKVTRPMVLCAIDGGENGVNEGPVGQDTLDYPVVIGLFAPVNRDNSQTTRQKWLRARQLIRHAFISQRLVTATAQVVIANNRTAEAANPRAWEANLLASPIRLAFRSREYRGLGVM